MTQRVTRQELYELVWAEPISKLAARFGVSGVALAKACQRMQVPVPPRGWWAQKAAGRSSAVQARLALRPPGLDDQVVIGGGHYAHYHHVPSAEEILSAPIPLEPSFEEDLEALRERVKTMVGKVAVPRSLTHPHPVVASLLAQDDARREKLKAPGYHFTWEAPKFDSSLERRHLKLLSTIFSALARCDSRIESRAQEGRIFTITIGHQRLNLAATVEERRKRVPHRAGAKPEVEKRIRLALGVQHDGTGAAAHAWEDGDTPLEKQLQEIVVETIVHGEVQHRAHMLGEHRWRVERKAQLEEEVRRRKAEAERQQRKRQAQQEQERLDRLLGETASLARAQEIRRYVGAARQANAAAADPVPPGEMDAWSDWALAQADQIDPVKSGAFRRPYRNKPEEV